MAGILDYIDWRGDLTFRSDPLNEVDNEILSQLCFIDFEGIVPAAIIRSGAKDNGVTLRSAAKQYLRRHRGEQAYIGAIVPSAIVTLLARAAKSHRFGNIHLYGYINHINDEQQTQFSATTFLLDDGTVFVAYRGTDDTIVGWKENFNMSFISPVPAQIEAVSYLESVASSLEGPIITGGHSKGGNLSVYSAVKCSPEVKERIKTAYSNDGPGFSSDFITSLDFENMRGKLRTIVPQSSVVGMLLEHEETYEVVKSTQNGLMQHDGFSWEVMGKSFVHLDTVTNESRLIDTTLKKWLNDMDTEQREAFVDSMFEALEATNAKTLTDLNSDKFKLVKAWSGLDIETRNIVKKSLRLLLKEGAKTIKSGSKNKKK